MKQIKFYKMGNIPLNNKGAFPPVSGWDYKNYDLSAPDSFKNLDDDFFMEVPPNFNTFFMAKRSIVTDMLGQGELSSYGFFISSELKNILHKFSSDNIAFYPAQLNCNHIKKQNLNYFFIHTIVQMQSIDFANSTVEDIITDEFIDLKSYEHYQKLDTEEDIKFSKITLKKMLHIYRVPRSPKILVSEELKNELEKNKFTGIGFIENEQTSFFLNE